MAARSSLREAISKGGIMSHKALLVAMLLALAIGFSFMIADAQGPKPTPPKPKAPTALNDTLFIFQGQLKQGEALENSSCDFEIGLWDLPAAGPQYGLTQTITGQAVKNGLFTIALNFGN